MIDVAVLKLMDSNAGSNVEAFTLEDCHLTRFFTSMTVTHFTHFIFVQLASAENLLTERSDVIR